MGLVIIAAKGRRLLAASDDNEVININKLPRF